MSRTPILNAMISYTLEAKADYIKAVVENLRTMKSDEAFLKSERASAKLLLEFIQSWEVITCEILKIALKDDGVTAFIDLCDEAGIYLNDALEEWRQKLHTLASE